MTCQTLNQSWHGREASDEDLSEAEGKTNKAAKDKINKAAKDNKAAS